MPVTNSDAILWYNVGIFGDAGYAVPNWSNDIGSLNPQIYDLVDMIGRNLFHLMHHEDVDLRIPPSINTLKRVHKLYIRTAQILAGRAVPSNVDNMETQHVRPAGEVFRVYPVPFFKVRNKFLRRWAEYILIALAEAMQHTENRKELEVSTAFAGQIGQYPRRVYTNMAIELFGKTREEATSPEFVLTQEDFDQYDPAQFFTSTELVDTVPRLDRVFTEDRLELLAEGVPIVALPELGPWPMNLTNLYAATREGQTTEANPTAPGEPNSGGGSESAVPVMPPAPGP